MRLQKDVEYALISLLALGNGSGLLSTAELSRRNGIPRSLLAKLLQRLQKGGLIEAERGARGGYRLRRPLETITVQEVVEAVRGVERLTPCLDGEDCGQADSCTIRQGVTNLQRLFEELLSSLSLAHLGGLSSDGAPGVAAATATAAGRAQIPAEVQR